MQELRIVKKQLIMDLDKNEAPSGWRWRVDRFVRFDDGAEKIVPDEIPATEEEVRAHIGVAVAKQAADIAADSKARDALQAQLTTVTAQLAAVREADSDYNARMRAVFPEKPAP